MLARAGGKEICTVIAGRNEFFLQLGPRVLPLTLPWGLLVMSALTTVSRA